MRIPRVAPANVGASYPGTRLSGPSGGAALAAGLANLSETAAHIAGQQQKLAAQEAQRRGTLEAADLLAQTEIAVQNYRATLETVTDPDEYLAKLREGADTIAKETFGRAKEPAARDLLAQKIPGLLATYDGQALARAKELRTQRFGATVTRTLDNIEMLAGKIDISDDAAFSSLMGQAATAVAAAAPHIGGEDAAEKLWIARRERLFAERAERHAHQDPAGFLGAVDTKYRGLDPLKRNTYVKAAEDRIITDRKAHNAEREKWYDALDKEAEQERQGQLTGLREQALKGALTVAALDQARAARVITSPEEYSTLYTLATTKSEQPSDPATLLSVRPRVFTTSPSMSSEAIWALHRTGKLNAKDAEEMSRFVIGRANDQQGEGRTERNQRHAQAEQIIKSSVGITGFRDKYDHQDEQLSDMGLRELTARSSAFGGKEDPIAVANEIANRLAPIRQERMKLSVSEIGRALMFPAPDAATAMANLNARRATLPPAVLAQEERKIADMTRAEAAAGPAGAKATQTGAKLRAPGTKPQGGKADD